MTIGVLLKAMTHGLLAILFSAEAVYAVARNPVAAPSGTYETSWIGNSFGGGGFAPKEGNGFHANGYGYWVQDSISAMAVAPDGTVFLGSGWDEAERTLGLYKNGTPNRVLTFALDSPAKAKGGNDGNRALCVDGGTFYIGNLGKGLLKFQWTPGDINSGKYLAEVPIPEIPVGMSCGNGKILIAYPDKVELRDEAGMQWIANYPVSDLSAVLLAPDGSFWVIAGGQVRHLLATGIDTGVPVPGIGKPTSLAWGRKDVLIVSDDGPAQQVLFFDVSGQPRLVSSFGVHGGLYSGEPGKVAPQKLFALRGAGIDSAGNLYVGMSFSDDPNGNTFLRAFSPAGTLLWEDYATAFVDTFGFEPGSDGTLVYGRTTRWKLDLDRQIPGSEATLDAITFDPFQYPDDPRRNKGFSINPRVIGGTRLLYGLGQYSGGFEIFAEVPDSDIFHPVATPPHNGWAWYVTENGDIWNGDAPGRKIALYPLQSITGGIPVYDWQHPQTWPWPAGFQSVSRVIYQKTTDSLFVFGFQPGQSDNGGWGTVGFTARRYDGWRAGHPSLRWTNTQLPASPGALKGKTLAAKDVALAGDYLFLGMCRDGIERYAPKVAIVDAATGKYAGTLAAGPAVGGVGGWEDMAGSVQATQRANGEYLILVEEDWRGKNLLFRWKP